MKIWKKLALVLSLSFTFSSLTACELFGGEEENSSTSVEDSVPASDETSEPGDEKEKTTQEFKFAVNADVAETDDGMDMKLNLDMDIPETDADIPETDAETEMVLGVLSEMYYVDDFVYVCDPASGIWIKSPSTLSYMAGSEAAAVKEVRATVSDVIAELKQLSVSDSTVSMSYADDINLVLQYLATLNSETLVVDVIDTFLAFEDLSYDAIIEDLLSRQLGTLTVEQVYAMVEAKFIAGTEFTSLQEMKEALFANEEFYNALVVEIGAENAEIAKDFDLNSIVTDYGEMTLDDVINVASEEQIQTVEIFIRAFDTEFKKVTLGDIFGTMDDTQDDVTEYMEATSNVEYYFEELAFINVTKFDVTATTDSTLGKLSAAQVTVDFAMEVDTDEAIMELVFDLDMGINFVDEVTAPTGAMTMCYGCSEGTTSLYGEVYLCDECKALSDARYGEYSFVYYSTSRGVSKTADADAYPADTVVGADYMSLVINEDGTATLTAPWGTFDAVWYEDGFAQVGDNHGTAHITYEYIEEEVVFYMDFYGGETLGEDYYEYYVFKK